jgi:hypothetical protein
MLHFTHSDTTCGEPGILARWAVDGQPEVWTTQDVAKVDSELLDGSGNVMMKGSFVSDLTGTRLVYLWADTYKTSLGFTPLVELTFDSVVYPMIATSRSAETILTKDFRYPFSTKLDESYQYVIVLIQIVNEPTGSVYLVNKSCADTCEVSGCRDTALARAPYLCKPAPSPSPSHSPSPTASHSPFPSASPFFMESHSFSSSNQFTPSSEFSVLFDDHLQRFSILKTALYSFGLARI